MKVPKETVRNVQVLSKLHGLDWTRSHKLLGLMFEIDRHRKILESCKERRTIHAARVRVKARQAIVKSISLAEHYLKTCIDNPLK